MGFYRVRFSPRDVNATAIGFPSGYTRREVLVRISDSFVVLLAIFVLFRIRIWITAAPEVLNEVFTLLVRRQREESSLLIFGDDVIDVRIKPSLVSLFGLGLNGSGVARRI